MTADGARLLPILLPWPWPATDAGRQVWNIGPAAGGSGQFAVPTEQKVTLVAFLEADPRLSSAEHPDMREPSVLTGIEATSARIGGDVREFSGLLTTLCYCRHGTPARACQWRRLPGVLPGGCWRVSWWLAWPGGWWSGCAWLRRKPCARLAALIALPGRTAALAGCLDGSMTPLSRRRRSWPAPAARSRPGPGGSSS